MEEVVLAQMSVICELDILLAAPATPKGWPLPPEAGEKPQKNQDALINRVSGHSWWKTWKLHLGTNPVWVVILSPQTTYFEFVHDQWSLLS